MEMKSEVNIDLSRDDSITDSPEDIGTTNSSSDTRSGDRGSWANKLEFFLAIMGYTVGIVSVWRFPIICSRNGGGAFLIPFFFFLVTSGGPLYYLEVCLGQFTGMSAGSAFEFCPLLKGLGLLQVILSLTVLWYIMILLAWILYYLYSSMQPELPWTTCHNEWNTKDCIAITELWSNPSLDGYQRNVSSVNKRGPLYTIDISPGNQSMAYDKNTEIFNLTTNFKEFSSSAFEYWEQVLILSHIQINGHPNNIVILKREVNGRSRGLEEMGSVQIHLVVCFFLAWVFCVGAVIRGVKSLGKVVYVTATAPYVVLTVIFIKGLTLDGAMDGMKTFLQPDWPKLFLLRCSTLCVFIAGFTAFYNGLVVFALLGFMAKSSGVPIQDVASQSGPGLAFVVFPTVLSQMPLPQLWSALFFIMLATVAFDSLFGMFETVTSAFVDLFPHQLIHHRSAINVVAGLCFFISELPLTMNGGIYLMQLADWYFSQFALLVCSVLEVIAVCWIYGTDRFAKDIYMMTGRDVCVFLRVTWTIVIPLFMLVIFFTMLSQYSTPQYGDGYVYSSEAVATGIFIGLVPIFVMVGVGIFTFLQINGSLWQRLKKGLTPSKHWIPHSKEAEQLYLEKPYKYPVTWWKRIFLNLRGSKNNPIF